MDRDALIEKLRRLQPALNEQGVTHVALFGSRARGDARPDSDIDILIEVEKGRKFSLLDLIAVKHAVSDSTGLAASVEMRRSMEPEFASNVLPDIVEVF